jgi:hypothetical protein
MNHHEAFQQIKHGMARSIIGQDRVAGDFPADGYIYSPWDEELFAKILAEQ